MAGAQIGNTHGVTAAHAGDADTPTNLNGGDSIDTGYVDADLNSINAMKARLQTINAAYYTDDMLNSMTVNDLKYAIRLADAPNTV